MVGTPVSRRVMRHRRTASFRALLAMANISPVRPVERQVERNRIRRDRRRLADAAFYRGLLAYCGVPAQPRRRRAPVPPREDPDPVIVASSDTSAEDLPPQQLPREVVLLDIDSSVDELPDIDPRAQPQLPQRRHLLRNAYILLGRLQEPLPQAALRPLTPPPEVEPDVDWVVLEEGLADFDAPWQPQVEPQLPAIVGNNYSEINELHCIYELYESNTESSHMLTNLLMSLHTATNQTIPLN